MTTTPALTEDPDDSPDQNENDKEPTTKEPGTTSQEWLFQQFDAIAASNGAGHDRRPDRVFLENIRARKRSGTQNTPTDTTGKEPR